VTAVQEAPRSGAPRRLTPDEKVEAKRIIIESIRNGSTQQQAVDNARVHVNRIGAWRADDQEFARAYLRAREQQGKPVVSAWTANAAKVLPPFDEFRRLYLGQPLFPLHYNILDTIEGRTPRYMDTAMAYEPNEPTRVIVNIPPNHGKTTCFSIDFPVYLIHQNPGISIAIISKSQAYAKKILLAIKMRLTSRTYRNMHAAFAPSEGWRDPDGSWTQTQIYVSGKFDGETEKEPTVEAIGLGGHIYGGRFDVVILDDVVDSENVNAYEKQADWCMTMIDSRLPPDGGLMLMLGTRLASHDIYSELRSRKTEDDEQFFTYFSMPAVLEYGERQENWRTLWPWETCEAGAPAAEMRCIKCFHSPAECRDSEPDIQLCKPRWSGVRLAKRRFPLGERRWSLIWQQQQLPDDATFRYETLITAVDSGRIPGKLTHSWRSGGSDGLYMVGGLDPATTGHTAMVVAGLDRFTGKRWIIDGYDRAGLSPYSMREKIYELTEKHNIAEWVIERNAFQKFLSDDPELKQFLYARGCKITPHFTGQEKRDPDFGVMSIAPLFESTGIQHAQNQGWMRVRDGTERITLPDPRQHSWVALLISQLAAWEPSGMNARQKTDIVMALWFTEIAFKKILNQGRHLEDHVKNPFASKIRLADRQVVDLLELKAQQAETRGWAAS